MASSLFFLRKRRNRSKADMSVSHEIKNRLEQYLQQERSLLDDLFRLKKQQKNFGAEIGKAIIVEGVAAFAKDLLESSRAGKYGRKITKSILDRQQKEQFLIIEKNIENRHNAINQDIASFLSLVSMKKKDLKEPNSSLLIQKIEKAQNYAKVETCIKRTIKALTSIANRPLVYNTEIPVMQEVVIPPGKPFASILKLREILQSIQGYAKIIDPYVDETTLELLLNIPEGVPVKVLTAYTGGKKSGKRLERAYRTLKTERPPVEMRKCDPNLIHDRFILDQNRGWNIGSSLKDMGKKLSMIKPILAKSRRETERLFDEMWSKSNPVITRVQTIKSKCGHGDTA